MSQLRLLFFAELREQIGRGEQAIDTVEGETVDDLIERLIATEGEQYRALQNSKVQVAINAGLSEKTAAVPPAGELAFFPPVTGG